MGSVIPLKKSVNSAYLDLKNLLNGKLESVEKLINTKLNSDVDLIKKMSDYHQKHCYKNYSNMFFRNS